MNVALVLFVSLAAASLASMVVYALRGARRDAYTDSKGSRLFGGLAVFVQHWFIWAISPATTLSLRLSLTPDFYSFAALGFGLASGVLIAAGRLELGGWSMALSGVCDILDGRIAHFSGANSPYGDFIDATLDRFAEVFAFLGLAVYLRAHAHGALVTAAALAGSLLVSYTRARGEILGVACTGGLMQRAERLVLTCLACLLDPSVTAAFGWPPGTVVLWVLVAVALTTFVTAAHRTVWISVRLRGSAS